MNALKQCLHYDPDSKICLSQHRLVKNFDKGFAQVEEMLGKEDWRGIVKLLLTSGGGKTSDLWRKFEDAMEQNVKEDAILPLIPPELLENAIPDANKQTKKLVLKSLPMPDTAKLSIQRQTLVRALCKSFTHLADQSKGDEYKRQMGKWCSELLTMEGCADDTDGLVGKGEDHLGKEEYEEAVRVFDKAFEASGRSDRNVSFHSSHIPLTHFLYHSSLDPLTSLKSSETPQTVQTKRLLQSSRSFSRRRSKDN
jgi:DnaJ family protein C protein 3